MEIWIHINDSQEGPFAIEALPVDRITPDTPVWHEGLSDWTTAKNVPELAHLFAAAEPEAPAEANEPSACLEPPTPDVEVMPIVEQEIEVEQPEPQQPEPQQPADQWPPQQQQAWQPQPPRPQPQPQFPPQQPPYQQPPYQQGPYQQRPPYPQPPYGCPPPQQPWGPNPYQRPPYPPRPAYVPQPQQRPPMPPACGPMPDVKGQAIPKAPSMWLWASIPLTVIFFGNLFGIAAIVLGIISRQKYNAGKYDMAQTLSGICEWLIIIGITLGFAMIPFTLFL